MSRVPRVLLPWTLAMMAPAPVRCRRSRGGRTRGARGRAGPAAAGRSVRPTSALLDEMEKDVQHFARW